MGRNLVSWANHLIDRCENDDEDSDFRWLVIERVSRLAMKFTDITRTLILMAGLHEGKHFIESRERGTSELIYANVIGSFFFPTYQSSVLINPVRHNSGWEIARIAYHISCGKRLLGDVIERVFREVNICMVRAADVLQNRNGCNSIAHGLILSSLVCLD